MSIGGIFIPVLNGPAMGIDYGKARIGIAISDLSRTFAFGVKTIDNKHQGRDQALAEIVALISERKVSTVVIGLPRRTDGRETEMVDLVLAFAAKLRLHVSCEVLFENEQFTSKIALDNLHDAGVKKRKIKGILDQRAAELILQSYLDRNKPIP